MNKDRIQGSFEQAKGKAKEVSKQSHERQQALERRKGKGQQIMRQGAVF